MRLRFLSAFGLVAVSLGAIAFGEACKSKGNGVGTAPPNVDCPANAVEGAPCGALVVCGACSGSCASACMCGLDAGGACADAGPDGSLADASSTISDPAFFMYCPGGAGATWICVQGGDAGTLSDGDVGAESEVDGDASDAEVATDGDAETASDGDDATEAEADAGAESDAADEADAITDTAPEVDLDADADGD
jgi:hypothetical protein